MTTPAEEGKLRLFPTSIDDEYPDNLTRRGDRSNTLIYYE